MQGQHRTLRCRVLRGGGPAVSGLGTTKRRRGLSEPEPAVLSPEGRQPSARTARDSSNQIPLNVESCAVERKGAQGRRLSTPQLSRLPGERWGCDRETPGHAANKFMPAHRRLDEALVTRHSRNRAWSYVAAHRKTSARCCYVPAFTCSRPAREGRGPCGIAGLFRVCARSRARLVFVRL